MITDKIDCLIEIFQGRVVLAFLNVRDGQPEVGLSQTAPIAGPGDNIPARDVNNRGQSCTR
jgi:hypothetical protein